MRSPPRLRVGAAGPKPLIAKVHKVASCDDECFDMCAYFVECRCRNLGGHNPDLFGAWHGMSFSFDFGRSIALSKDGEWLVVGAPRA